MLEGYIDGVWKLYNIETGKKGKPENFVLFQRGGESLIDVEGGNNSTVKFSVMKSITSTLNLAGKRAKLAKQETLFDYSVFNLPLNEQNTIKWLTIFPLAIFGHCAYPQCGRHCHHGNIYAYADFSGSG